jgi:regulation of enolase protein 1 (concanavalin A-like superfamily)
MNAPALLMPASAPCILRARVTVEAQATFDAGVLAAYQSDEVWAKLCFERSPQGQLMIVSVVTRGSSDDANSVPIERNSIYLRLAKLENTYAFHYSHDGSTWNLVRHFSLGGQHEAHIGFLSQSPTGEGCTAHFSEIAYAPTLLSDLRSGE